MQWGIFVAGIVALIAARLLVKKSSDDFNSQLEKSIESHRLELENLRISLERERAEKEQAQKLYEQQKADIEKKYAAELARLSEAERGRIDDLIKENASDPVSLTKKLADIYGFSQ